MLISFTIVCIQSGRKKADKHLYLVAETHVTPNRLNVIQQLVIWHLKFTIISY